MADFFGVNGRDTINGTGQPDTISSLGGSDIVDGGGGDDTIVDTGGSHNTLKGNAGNDVIRLTDYDGGASIWGDVIVGHVIEGGTGNDSVYVNLQRHGSVSVDLGDGNDLLVLGQDENAYYVTQTSIALGAGQDRVVFGFGLGDSMRAQARTVTISDFQAGAGGDVLDLGDLVRGYWNNPGIGATLPGANPFAGGYLVLIQDGADTIVRLDYDGADGAPSTDFGNVLRLVGVNAALLTAANFGGLDPSGAAPGIVAINGTAGNDQLIAAVPGGQVNGLDGDDMLFGTAGDTELDGGTGKDVITGGSGDDHLIGGDGDDVLSDNYGNDSFDGGAGNDTINYVRGTNAPYYFSRTDHITISGGDGDDVVNADIRYYGPSNTFHGGEATVDLGAGNDRFNISTWAIDTVLTLGAGQDRVTLGSMYFANFQQDGTNTLLPPPPITITDFQTGDGGDSIDLASLFLVTGWQEGTNPFVTGYLRLQQRGADVVVSVDGDGAGGSDLLFEVIRLSNVSLASLTASNFSGFAPDGSAPAGVVKAGTVNADTFDGSDADDQLDGADGNDHLDASWGNDTVDGGAGDDWISGGRGSDHLTGGIGDDTILDLDAGSDTVDGGDGNDLIRIEHRDDQLFDTNVINAGNGNDQVFFNSSAEGSTTINLGAGNDRLTLGSTHADGLMITLGTGSDVVLLDPLMASQGWSPITITDFATGNSGDRLDWLALAQLKLTVYGDLDDFNPFALGKAELVQVGADTQLQLVDGPTLVIFKNRTVASFTNYNFGVDISARPPSTADTQTGTGSDNILNGTGGDDIISGLGGNDHLNGLGGADVLHGNDGDDTLDGGDGDDVIDGGAGADTATGGIGNDTIGDPNGYDVISGGDGDDRISVSATPTPGMAPGSTDAGAGNDTLTISVDPGGYHAAMGSGDDTVHVTFRLAGDLSLDLGAGADTIVMDRGTVNGAVIRASDFQTGAGGDKFDLDSFLGGERSGWADLADEQKGDPFALGYFELHQVGADVELWYLPSGARGPYDTRVAVFANTDVADFTADNFGGADPHATPNHAVVLNGDLTIAAGETQAISDPTPYELGSTHYVLMLDPGVGGAQFVNNGTASITNVKFGNTVGFYVSPFSSLTNTQFHNTATGHFLVTSDWLDVSGSVNFGTTYGFYAQGASVPILNDGEFRVEAASGTAWGIVTAYDAIQNPPVVNHGTITVTSAYDAIGIQFGAGGSLTNSGTLTVHGDDFAVGVYISQNRNQPIVNTGTITVTTGASSPYASMGILVDQGGVPGVIPAFGFTNAGTISADIAIDVLTGSNSGPFDNVITNNGTIHGAVILGTGNDTVTNKGAMSGRTLLGEDNDTYNGTTGTHLGTIEGGSGDDTLTGGNGAEVFFGNRDDDQIYGRNGSDYIDGGTGSDLLDGGAGTDMLSYFDSVSGITADLELGTVTTATEFDWVRSFEQVVGSRTGDTIRGSAQDEELFGFHGNDVLEGRDGNDTLLGNKGNDTLTGGNGADVFVFEKGDGSDEITDFTADDAINIYGYAGAQSITQVGADVRIKLSATDSILVRGTTVAALGGAHLTFSAGASGISLPDYTDETIVVDDDLVVAAGVNLAFGDANPLRTSTDAAPITGIFIDAPGENWNPSLGIWNSGSISLVTSDPNDLASIGIYHAYEGTAQTFVNNAGGSLTVTAAHAEAVGTSGISQIWNTGRVTVSSASGDATAFDDVSSISTNFVNRGMVNVTADGAAFGLRQGFTNSAGISDYFNLGSMTVHGGEASVGFFVRYSDPSQFDRHTSRFVNSGTITVTDDTAAIDSIGVEIGLYQRAAMWNSGTITADFAIRTVPDRSGAIPPDTGNGLDLYNSGTLNGLVYLSGFDDKVVNRGTINGDMWFGGGNDLYDGRLVGTSTGTIDGFDGNDTLLAGTGGQTLIGGFGDDTLSGGAGTDTLSGGDGQDSFRYETGFGADVITDFDASAAGDRIDVAGYTSYQSIVQQGDDVLITFSATDTLLVRHAQVAQITGAVHFGAAAIGANAIPGAPAAPATPAPPAGGATNDFVFKSTGTANADTLVGGAGPDDMAGLGGNDSLTSGSGDDRLDGGTGADQMYGGTGDDSYLADQAGDLVFENAGEGTDTVTASAGYYLYANVENLVLKGGAGDIFGVGNELANTITGNTGANLLIAGAGDDTARGGGGGDSLFGQDGVDQLFGEAGVDYLVGGIGDDMLDGGTEADALYGEDGNDTLWGGAGFVTDIFVGGAGNDTLRGDSGSADYDLMDGGAGDDAYYVDTGDDLTFEASGGGTDTVYANVAGANNGVYLYANVENLVLLNTTKFGVGNELANIMTGSASGNWLLGGAGNDTLNGKAGGDVLFGEAGTDTFIFEHGTGGDVIGDFAAGNDKIDLSAFGLTWQAVQNSMHEVGGTTAIDLGGGDFIVLNGVASAALHEGDFILSGGSSAVVALEAKVGDPFAGFDSWRAGLIREFDDPRTHVPAGALLDPLDPLS